LLLITWTPRAHSVRGDAARTQPLRRRERDASNGSMERRLLIDGVASRTEAAPTSVPVSGGDKSNTW
jgi:hypothetical protein